MDTASADAQGEIDPECLRRKYHRETGLAVALGGFMLRMIESSDFV